MMTKCIVALGCLSTVLFGAETVADSTNTLGLKLYRDLAKEGENLCFSPYSIQSALSMTANGAAGETAREMQKALQHEGLLDGVNAGFQGYQEALQERLQKQDKTQLKVANCLFAQEGDAFNPRFRGVLKDSYAAPLLSMDFAKAADSSRKQINGWVSDKTQKKIENLLPEGAITPLTRLVLTNCLYFKSSWKTPFKKHKTELRDFYTTPEKSQQVPTMAGVSVFGYKKAEGYQVVTLPYGGGTGFQCFVVLPEKGKSVAEVVNTLTKDELASFGALPKQRLELYLPKFKVTTPSMALAEPMQKLGMVSAFDATTADFSNMSEEDGLSVTSLYHKAFIELDENGTEAAAATAVAIGVRSMPVGRPKLVKVNRPFFFGIQDAKTGCCFFLGAIQKLQ